jgi:putative ABC transport system permease protein
MLAELQNSIGNDVLTGLAQAGGAIALCAAVVALCRWQSVHVEREAVVSMARGLVQMVLVGLVLALLLHGRLLIGCLILFMMAIAAAITAAQRLKGMAGALPLCFWSIAVGAGTVIAVMLATRSLQPDISMLVPVGSMIIANAMNACAQAIERLRPNCWPMSARSRRACRWARSQPLSLRPTFRVPSMQAFCPGST